MTRRRARTALLGIVLAIVGVRPAFAQDEPRVSLSTTVDYSVGDYGTGHHGERPRGRAGEGLLYPDPGERIYSRGHPILQGEVSDGGQGPGLGTGEFDETLGVDVSKLLVGSLFGYLELAYTFIGEPSGTTLHNTFGWSVGAAYAIAQPFSVFAFLEGATAIAPGQDDPLDIRVGAEYRIIKALKLTGAVTRGLSNGSADWGVSGTITLRF